MADRNKISTDSCTDRLVVSVKAAKAFVERAMTAVGTKQSHASMLADALVLADQRGQYTHGLHKLEKYLKEVKSECVETCKEPFIQSETVSTALVNGNNVLGCVVGNYAMNLAIQKARETGVGWVVANNSNHYGIAGLYSLQASDAGMLGLSFTNTSPFMIATRSKEKALGTNPLSLAAPSSNPDDPFVLDMATSAVALGKVRVAHTKGEKVPLGWGTDADGKATDNPDEILNGCLMPLGGTELNGGYKGYGLAMMVEILCGITANSAYGPNIKPYNTFESVANLGHCFIAVDPNVFAPGFKDRMSDLMKTCRNLQTAEGETAVLVPGDPEKQAMKKVEDAGGIMYHPNVLEYLDDLASRWNVEPVERRLLSTIVTHQ